MKTTAILGAATFALLALAPTGAKAETFQTCKGYITSIPTVITQQGTWCFNKDLSAPLASGAAITIANNNITIDCNSYKLGGQAAGIGTQATGIKSVDHINVSIRGCTVRGFQTGISITGEFTSGHVIDGNRVDYSTRTGIELAGSGSVVKSNIVTESGGAPDVNWGRGMAIGNGVDVLDNLIDGVYAGTDVGTPTATGIYLYDSGSVVRGNRIRNVTAGSGNSYGVYVYGAGNRRVVENDMFGLDESNSYGVYCATADSASAADNYFADFTFGNRYCSNDGGNVTR